ncbi:Linoleate 10R-lipoxygenase COP4 [Hypsizygus marmoreus]|uniref:Terpene synthase n=1 Tax=Hypsizygus marmoreus TaxID=39966 RepID=A0A369K2K5_HYPMA|nr:Linoleate 10R-lipoxygenase COP4 [Hypsizygus marmoreus]
MSSVEHFILPDLLAMCPLDGAKNPHYERGAAESRAWINSYNVFTDRKRAFFVLGSNELLVSRAYAYAGHEQFRTCCDFVNVLFVFDEFSDDQDGKGALATGNIFLNAMKDPNWDDRSTFSQMTKVFRTRFLRLCRPKATARFLKHWETYCASVVKEAELREANTILDVDSFIALRRENSAVRLCYGLVEYCLGTDLPDDVFEDPTFMEIYWAAVDLVCWANDVYSYDMEQSKGIDGNNIVTVLMKNNNITLQEASDYVGVHAQKLMDRFISAQTRLPSWGASVDSEIARYIKALGFWVKGNLDWSFETQRYFGAKHLEIKDTRLVTLRPRERPAELDIDSDVE